MTGVTLVITAKACVPGRVKTRLVPPLTAEEAATVARAALTDTLEAAIRLPAARHVLFWDGAAPDPAETPGWQVLPQPAGRLDERLGALFDMLAGPTLMIGMDTPQIAEGSVLAEPLEAWHAGTDAWFGPASDGGYWALGMRVPRGELIRGIGMSRADTGRAQLARLRDSGLRVGMLGELTDVDDSDSAEAVAALAPRSRFARAWRAAAAGAAR